ncbi:probable disease resistance protein At4g19520 [Jatropha curcas]|uniref:probable disease resistance protein At4g19520 n=1 Tax=Jatropha curcas TaxID=180498 RepID=UPI001892F30D|nr:probable disease resistance protein At4g19520 [Jatropha curcas]
MCRYLGLKSEVNRTFLKSEDFPEIHTPELIAGSSEGGSAVFKLDYKWQPACLAQSPQLHKQMAICGDLERESISQHLLIILVITTFIDYTGLETGEEISPNLLKAIEESKMSVIIFSKNYASSQWCLDELVKIMECMKSIGQKVLPIFYRVDPSDVRNQTGNFGDGFRKVKEQFQEDAEKIDRWITALTKAANLSGWDSNNYRYESELSEGIVNRILKKLYPAYYSVCSNLPGIDLHINNLLSLLSIGSEDVRFIGIWGMGGIGKTTIAEVLLSRIFDKFDDCCFLSNIREKSEKDGLFHLRKCLFSKLLQIQNENLNLEMFGSHMKEAVEGIFLDMSKMGKDTGFMLESPQSNYLQYLSNKLSLLHWEEYPYKSMPSSFFMENLVQLDLRESRIEQLWTGDKCPQQLKYLNLFGSMQLTRLPNLSSATNLEWINLGLCVRLIEIPSSIQCLLKLKYLDLYRCKKLRTLPNLIQLKSLAHLRLSYCSNLKTALEIPRSIQVLELEWSGLEVFSLNVQVLDNLQYLSMWQCKNLRSLPRCINLNYVIKKRILDLTGCLNLKKFPVILGNIEVLMLNQTGIEELPSSIQYLSSLVELEMKKCVRLQSLPSSICELKLLQKFVLSGCSKLNKLPPLYGLYSLEELYLDGSRLKEIPSDIVSLTLLRVLNLNNCDKLQGLPELPCRLMELQAANCTSVKTAKSSSSFACIGHLRNFWQYKYLFNYCNCINLSKNVRCKIVEDVRQRIEEIAFATAMAHRRGIYISKWDIVIGLPGGEIPEWDTVVCLFKKEVPEWDTIGFPSRIPKWFSYQGQGSSFSILFPPNWFDVLGFTFCAVIEFDIPLNKCDDFFITCECHFKSDNGGRKVQFRSSTIHLEVILHSDHLFLWYDNFHANLNLRKWLIGNKVNEGLCKFKAEARGFNKGKLKVNGCGLQLRYAEWMPGKRMRNRLQNKISVECGSTKRRSREDYCSNQTDIIGDGMFDYVEEEPHPKRLKQAILLCE